MNRGVIYWIAGTKLCVRLYVSLASLREVYDGPVTVITNYDVPDLFIEMMEKAGFDVRDMDHSEAKENDLVAGKEGLHKRALLGKTMINRFSPYENSVYIDCDTLILREFNNMFDWADDHRFVVTQFAAWGTHRKSRIGERIAQFKGIAEDGLVEKAHAYGHAINVGVFSFYRDATIFDDWFDLAHAGKDTYIPDEAACQVLLPKHKHYLAPQHYNSSCKFTGVSDETRIIHYHGRKHADAQKTRGTGSAELWIEKYTELIKNDWEGMKAVSRKWPDRRVRKLNIG